MPLISVKRIASWLKLTEDQLLKVQSAFFIEICHTGIFSAMENMPVTFFDIGLGYIAEA